MRPVEIMDASPCQEPFYGLPQDVYDSSIQEPFGNPSLGNLAWTMVGNTPVSILVGRVSH